VEPGNTKVERLPVRHLVLGLVLITACAGTAEPATTTKTSTTTLSTSTTTTSTTVPATTTTTIDAQEARAAIWSVLTLAVSGLGIGAASTSEENILEFNTKANAVIEMIEGMRTGPVGWGDCEDSVSALEDAMVFWQEGVRLASEGINASDADTINDAVTLVELGTDKLNEARLLRDICLG